MRIHPMIQFELVQTHTRHLRKYCCTYSTLPLIYIYIYTYIHLVGGLEHGFYFSIYWECHHPNWRIHIFQRGRYTTNQISISKRCKSETTKILVEYWIYNVVPPPWCERWCISPMKSIGAQVIEVMFTNLAIPNWGTTLYWIYNELGAPPFSEYRIWSGAWDYSNFPRGIPTILWNLVDLCYIYLQCAAPR